MHCDHPRSIHYRGIPVIYIQRPFISYYIIIDKNSTDQSMAPPAAFIEIPDSYESLDLTHCESLSLSFRMPDSNSGGGSHIKSPREK